MKFFGWMQSKLNGKQDTSKRSSPATTFPVPPHHNKQEAREEFKDWPHGLLAIGTFGNNQDQDHHQLHSSDHAQSSSSGNNNDIIEQQEEDNNNNNSSASSSPDQDMLDFAPEEVGKLQKELTKLLSKSKSKSKSKKAVEKEVEADLPLDRFLNCPSTLEISRRMSTSILTSIDPDNHAHRHHHHAEDDDVDDDIERTISIIIDKCKHICSAAEKRNKSIIGKKSISFLLKKIFVCSSGFASPPPPPPLRDSLQESRMEKLLRTLLHKKMNPQRYSRASSKKKFIQHKNMEADNVRNEEEEESGEKACKWDKTDSEFIVLEI